MRRFFIGGAFSKAKTASATGAAELEKMIMKTAHQKNVEFVMAAAKCSDKFARRALRATKGQDWTAAATYVRNEIATRSVPTGPEVTCEALAKTWA